MNDNTLCAKLTVLVTTATKHRLRAEAREKKMSVGDLVRRRLDGELDSEERLFLGLLAECGRHAKSVLERVDATCDELQRDRATWPAREADIRRATLDELTSHGTR